MLHPGTFDSIPRRGGDNVQRVSVGRYEQPDEVGWRGWVEPEDKSWIVFVPVDGPPLLFSQRDSSGAVVEQAA